MIFIYAMSRVKTKGNFFYQLCSMIHMIQNDLGISLCWFSKCVFFSIRFCIFEKFAFLLVRCFSIHFLGLNDIL